MIEDPVLDSGDDHHNVQHQIHQHHGQHHGQHHLQHHQHHGQHHGHVQLHQHHVDHHVHVDHQVHVDQVHYHHHLSQNDLLPMQVLSDHGMQDDMMGQQSMLLSNNLIPQNNMLQSTEFHFRAPVELMKRPKKRTYTSNAKRGKRKANYDSSASDDDIPKLKPLKMIDPKMYYLHVFDQVFANCTIQELKEVNKHARQRISARLKENAQLKEEANRSTTSSDMNDELMLSGRRSRKYADNAAYLHSIHPENMSTVPVLSHLEFYGELNRKRKIQQMLSENAQAKAVDHSSNPHSRAALLITKKEQQGYKAQGSRLEGIINPEHRPKSERKASSVAHYNGGRLIWSSDLDRCLLDAKYLFSDSWEKVAAYVREKGGIKVDQKQCYKRWRNAVDPALRALKSGPWSPEEDAEIIKLVKGGHFTSEKGKINWVNIASIMQRKEMDCMARYTKKLTVPQETKKSTRTPFSDEENQIIVKMVAEGKTFTDIGKYLGRSCGNCSFQYKNFLRTKFNRGMANWTKTEDDILLRMVNENKNWNDISVALEVRNPYDCKRRYMCIQRGYVVPGKYDVESKAKRRARERAMQEKKSMDGVEEYGAVLDHRDITLDDSHDAGDVGDEDDDADGLNIDDDEDEDDGDQIQVGDVVGDEDDEVDDEDEEEEEDDEEN